jgi:hypothetical protein
MLVLYAVNHRVHVELGEEADVTPFTQIPDLSVAVEPMPDDGPVLVQVEYRIDEAMRPAFLHAIQAVEATRRRNGANSWRVFRDVGDEGRYVERYVITSWAEYVRLRMRMTVADRHLQNRVQELQRKDVPIRISRLIGVSLAEMGLRAITIPRQPQTGELPTGLGREEVPVARADVRARRSEGPASQDVLIAHELAVVLPTAPGDVLKPGRGCKDWRSIPTSHPTTASGVRRRASPAHPRDPETSGRGPLPRLLQKQPAQGRSRRRSSRLAPASTGTCAAACSHSASVGRR